jgi:hypothetical protein
LGGGDFYHEGYQSALNRVRYPRAKQHQKRMTVASSYLRNKLGDRHPATMLTDKKKAEYREKDKAVFLFGIKPEML